MWSDFNAANRSAMMKSELFSWPVTLAILVLAFGSLVAASLPLMLTIVGLVASAGVLYLGTLVADISIWSMNFALMFALALGIDYALFIVVRYRAAHFGHGMTPADAAGVAMDTAGKAVLFSGVTVLISLSAVMLVPSPAFRSMALGIMVAVVFILAATLTLLPAVLGALGPKVDNLALQWVHSGEHRSPLFARWAERIWARPLLYGVPALLVLLALAAPVLGLKTGMPSIKVVPRGDSSRDRLHPGAGRVRRRARPARCSSSRPAATPPRSTAAAKADPGIAGVMPAQTSTDGRYALVQAIPQPEPVRPRRRPHDRPAPRARSPRARSSAAPPPRTTISRPRSHDATPLVIGVVLALGFLLLLVALQAPIIALVGVLTNLLATGAAFGVARLIFQDGHLAGLLGFESQGFLDAWGPVFFFAMIFAISMDYTVFLLASAKEHLEQLRRRRPRGDDRRRRPLRPRHPRRRRRDGRGVLHLRALRARCRPRRWASSSASPSPLDAFLVRLLLVPVALRLLGRWAWWLPAAARPDAARRLASDTAHCADRASARFAASPQLGSATSPKPGSVPYARRSDHAEPHRDPRRRHGRDDHGEPPAPGCRRRRGRDHRRRSRRRPRLPARAAVRAVRARRRRRSSCARAAASCTATCGSSRPRSTTSTPAPTRCTSATGRRSATTS